MSALPGFEDFCDICDALLLCEEGNRNARKWEQRICDACAAELEAANPGYPEPAP